MTALPPVRRFESLKSVAGLVVWLGGLGVAMGLLIRIDAGALDIDWGDVGFWIRATPPERVLIAVMRVVAIALVCWLLVASLACLVAQASGIPALVRRVDWFTPALVRDRVKMAVAVGAVAVVATATPIRSVVSNSHRLQGSEVVRDVSDDAIDQPWWPLRPDPVPEASTMSPKMSESEFATPESGGPAGESPPAAQTRNDPVEAPQPKHADEYVVSAGDSFWKIAEDHVAAYHSRHARAGAPSEVAVYWKLLVETNRERLRSGDPNLIYPGERLVVPPSQPDSHNP